MRTLTIGGADVQEVFRIAGVLSGSDGEHVVQVAIDGNVVAQGPCRQAIGFVDGGIQITALPPMPPRPPATTVPSSGTPRQDGER